MGPLDSHSSLAKLRPRFTWMATAIDTKTERKYNFASNAAQDQERWQRPSIWGNWNESRRFATMAKTGAHIGRCLFLIPTACGSSESR